MAYITFRGITSDENHIPVVQMPSRVRAKKRVKTYTVDGRDGTLTTTDGCYEDIKLMMKLGINGQNEDAVYDWLTGEGNLILSDDPTRCYRARVDEEITSERNRDIYDVVNRDVLTVTFTCKPHRYLVNPAKIYLPAGEETETLVFNPGNANALPVFEVYGDGTGVLTIGTNDITLTGLNSAFPVVINSETGRAYLQDDEGTATMIGEFPVFAPGFNVVAWDEGITSMTIYPGWRWL